MDLHLRVWLKMRYKLKLLNGFFSKKEMQRTSHFLAIKLLSPTCCHFTNSYSSVCPFSLSSICQPLPYNSSYHFQPKKTAAYVAYAQFTNSDSLAGLNDSTVPDSACRQIMQMPPPQRRGIWASHITHTPSVPLNAHIGVSRICDQ